MSLLSVNYVFIVFILKVMNTYFKRLKLVVCQQLLFLRFAHSEAGIVPFTPNTSCHDAYCQRWGSDTEGQPCLLFVAVKWPESELTPNTLTEIPACRVVMFKMKTWLVRSSPLTLWSTDPVSTGVEGFAHSAKKKKNVTFSENEFLSCDY